MLLLMPSLVVNAASAEVPEAIYNGANNASVMLNNMNYNDVTNSNTWAKEAII